MRKAHNASRNEERISSDQRIHGFLTSGYMGSCEADNLFTCEGGKGTRRNAVGTVGSWGGRGSVYGDNAERSVSYDEIN